MTKGKKDSDGKKPSQKSMSELIKESSSPDRRRGKATTKSTSKRTRKRR